MEVHVRYYPEAGDTQEDANGVAEQIDAVINDLPKGSPTTSILVIPCEGTVEPESEALEGNQDILKEWNILKEYENKGDMQCRHPQSKCAKKYMCHSRSLKLCGVAYPDRLCKRLSRGKVVP